MSFVQRLRASGPAASRRSAVARSGAALAIAGCAFLLYYATLLPGVDFGDSGSIQTTVGSPLLTPRTGYPLYFAIGALVLRATGAAPAFAMNLTSAIEAAAACGAFVLVAAAMTGSVGAAAGGALLFAVSYTFWSQAVTAEVYALHILLVLIAILLLLRWQERPSPGRLAIFFCAYAIGFGNHLSMVLLLPAFVLFLLISEPRGWRWLFSPRIVLLATAIAAAGAAQYLWNLRSLWFEPEPPPSLVAALRAFWFDVTKSDWRDTMVLHVPQSLIRDHAAMYWFDLQQQFGWPAVAAAAAGAVALAARCWRRALLLLAIFAANAVFAFGYNVGDTHVFYLPSHLIVALLIACCVAAVGSVAGRHWGAAAIAALLLYAGGRAWRDFPALDRSSDNRAASVLEALTDGLDDRRNILLVDLNWQVANGLSYALKSIRPEAAAARMRDVLLYAPALVRDNLAAGRSVALTARAAEIFRGSYAPLFEIQRERPAVSFADSVASIPAGARYVLCVLKPTRDFALDATDLRLAMARLGIDPALTPRDDYVAIAGIAGSTPALVEAARRPFTRTVDLRGIRTEIRMESWLSADTIRRMGFGHVIANHRHALIVERGVSFVAFDDGGTPTATAYFANIFAELPRFVIRATFRG
jgi:hypothetical protein